VRLFARVHGRAQSEERWRWKLGRFGAVPNVWVAESAGEIVCQYAAMPASARLWDREATVMLAVDAMTAPDHRRQGLLTEVVGQAHDAWRRGGVALVLGLPNEQWGSRTRALGWTPLFRLRWLAFPLRPAAVLRRRFGPLVAAGLGPLAAAWFRRPQAELLSRAETVSEAGPAFDALWERLAGSASLSVRRDARWVGWRFLAAPDPGYRVLLAEGESGPLGWSAFRVDRSRGHAVGLLADAAAPPGSWRGVLAATLSALDAEGALTASTLAAEGSARYARLRQAGFVARPWGFGVHAVALDAALDVAALGRPAAWDMAGGDFDVI
jgi:hypothetical protein